MAQQFTLNMETLDQFDASGHDRPLLIVAQPQYIVRCKLGLLSTMWLAKVVHTYFYV